MRNTRCFLSVFVLNVKQVFRKCSFGSSKTVSLTGGSAIDRLCEMITSAGAFVDGILPDKEFFCGLRLVRTLRKAALLSLRRRSVMVSVVFPLHLPQVWLTSRTQLSFFARDSWVREVEICGFRVATRVEARKCPHRGQRVDWPLRC